MTIPVLNTNYAVKNGTLPDSSGRPVKNEKHDSKDSDEIFEVCLTDTEPQSSYLDKEMNSLTQWYEQHADDPDLKDALAMFGLYAPVNDDSLLDDSKIRF